MTGGDRVELFEADIAASADALTAFVDAWRPVDAGGRSRWCLAGLGSSRYAALVSGWDGEMNDEFRRKARALGSLCQDIVELRRGDHYAERLRLDLERFADSSKANAIKALEIVLEETKQWPEVRKAFQDAFALYRHRKKDSPPTDQTESK